MMVIHWWLFIITKTAMANLKFASEIRYSTSVEATMRNITKSCYGNYNASNPIFVHGDIDNFIESVFDTKPAPIISMNDLKKNDDNRRENSSYEFKPNIIILVGDSLEKLQIDLLSLRETKWWNYMAHFFILGRMKNQCKSVSDILTMTWKMNIIMAIYICLNSENMPELYTRNPITDYTLSPWKKMNSSVDLNIYYQSFDPNISCKNLDYDKTKFLNGYGIKGVLGDLINTNMTAMSEIQVKLFTSVSVQLNASLTIEIEPPGEAPIQRLANGTADVMITANPIEWNPERQFLFSCMWAQIIGVRKSDPYLSTLEKIDNLWSLYIRILAIFTLFIFFLVLVHENTEISSALLDIIRLLTYVSIRTDRKKLSFRIFFAVILMLMIISNGVFQGSISAFLTKPEYPKGINTIEKLKELNYTIYTPLGSLKHAQDVFPNNQVIEVSSPHCPKFLQNTSKAICIVLKEFYYERWAELPLIALKEPLRMSYFNNKCRDDWPLYDRVNNIFIRLLESGLFIHWFREKNEIPMLKRRAYDKGLLSPQYQPVKLEALDFAFELLAIGLSLATIVFLLELICKKLNITAR